MYRLKALPGRRRSSRLREAIEQRMKAGAVLVPLEIAPAEESPNPWIQGPGMFQDDPLFDQWQTAIAEYRREIDQDSDAPCVFSSWTRIVSLLQRGHPEVSQRCAAQQPGEVVITVISLEEQLSGWYRLLRQVKQRDDLARVYKNLIDTVVFLARLPILPFRIAAITHYTQLLGMKLNCPPPWLSQAKRCAAAIGLKQPDDRNLWVMIHLSWVDAQQSSRRV